MIDWTGEMWYIYAMEYYAAIKNDEFVAFVWTWMNLENIILSKLTQEQKMKYRIFSLIGGWWTMRTHGHREGSATYWDLLGGIGEGQWGGGELRRDSMGRNARCGWRGGRQQITLIRVYLCNYLACSAHVPQNLKRNLKNFFNKKEKSIKWKRNTKNNRGKQWHLSTDRSLNMIIKFINF